MGGAEVESFRRDWHRRLRALRLQLDGWLYDDGDVVVSAPETEWRQLRARWAHEHAARLVA
jgi:hypothetical protein